MAISDKNMFRMNRMNRIAWDTQLGTAIQTIQNNQNQDLALGRLLVGDASAAPVALDLRAGGNIVQGNDTTVAALDASGDGKLLFGNGTILVSSSMSGDATITNAGVITVGAGKIEPAMIDRDEISLDLTAKPWTFAGVLTDGNIEDWVGPEGVLLQCLNVGDKTAAATWVRGTGLDFNFDATDNEGAELTVDGSATGADASFVAGTDNFYVEAKIALADVTGADECYIGLRKAEAFNATFDNYDEACTVNLNAGDVFIETILNNGATAAVDTTDNIADAEYLIARIEHSSAVALSTCITLMAGLTATAKTHYEDATEHTAGLQANWPTTVPTTLATLITAVTAAMASYVLHDADANLGSAWLYHVADGDDDSLTSEVAPTDLPECVTRLLDLRTKLNLHVADGTSHTDGDSGLNTTTPAGAVTITTGINTALAAPTATTQFTFDDAEEVVPFIRVLNTGDFVGTVVLSSFKCGRL